MKKIHIILLFITVYAFGQGEARNWYFGKNAGIKFLEDGSVVPLDGSNMFTSEGCSAISDSEGNLLFYTDGRNVWDRNHTIMPNGNYNAGTGLMGDPSSTQSAIIVPRIDNPNIYYIFTVDEPHHENAAVHPNQFMGPFIDNGDTVPAGDDGFNNGLNYSIADLSVTGSNGSMGDIITRNVHLQTYDSVLFNQIKYKCSEKITAVKNAGGNGYWVITHFFNKFLAFKVDSSGVDLNPVVTQIDPLVPVSGYTANSAGYLKASPDGKKLAIAHLLMATSPGGSASGGAVYLYDFNAATGIVSNPIPLTTTVYPYGVEFSQETKKLYITGSGLRQYNLLVPDVPASEVTIVFGGPDGALQLGPNGKIYRTTSGTQLLDVINNPEEDGLLCNYQPQSQPTGGPGQRFNTRGLPPFITSFFSASILVTANCLGQATQFSLNANHTVDSVTWNFGDGSPTSTQFNPTHTYAAAGNYNVVADVVKNGVPSQLTSDVTITPVPVANTTPNLVECDPDNNNTAAFNLANATPAILGGQSSTQYGVKYFLTQQNADDDTQAIIGNTFTNTTNPQAIFARVQSSANPDCYATTSFQLHVSDTPALAGTVFAICDDAADGNDANGQAVFSLAAVTQEVVQNNAAFNTTYYADANDAQVPVNALPPEFYNTVPNQQVIYARIENIAFPACISIEPITLTINPLPAAVTDAVLKECELSGVPDGIAMFGLHDADLQFTGGDTALTTAYYESVLIAQNNGPTLPNTYSNISNPQQIAAKVTNTQTGCYRILPLLLTATPTVFTTGGTVINNITINDLRHNSTITVHVSNPAANYLYSLDLAYGPFRESGYFDNVPSGLHTVYVYDTDTCTITSKKVAVLEIPNFFTPNGDGVNDTWNIIGVNALFYQKSKIYIFDRFGKLLASVDPHGNGWDGTQEGRRLPATDYWYVVRLDDGRTVKGHFSLMR